MKNLPCGIVLGIVAAAAPLWSQITNASSRVDVGSGANEVTVTFTIPDGPDAQVLVRGVGPKLQSLGINDAIADPAIEVFAGNLLVTANNDWGDSNPGGLATLFQQVGAFGFADGSADAALVATLAAGTYSVRVFGQNGATGLGLAEIYFVSGSGAGFSGFSFQANLTNGGSVSASFVTNQDPSTLLVRGLGPSLAAPGAMTDPELTVSRFGDGTVATNDNWGTNANFSLVDGASQAVGLSPLAANDSAALQDFAAGLYIATLSPVLFSSTGIGRIEVAAVTAVPEPATIAVWFGSVIFGFALLRSRDRRVAISDRQPG